MAEGGINKDSVQGQHDEYFEKTCTRCDNRGRNSEAAFYCQTCQQYFCSACKDIHGEFASDHHVFGDSESHLWGIKRSIDLDTEECAIHKGQRITIFCGQHEALCCAVCASLDHSTCVNKGFIPDIAQNISDSDEMKDVVKGICKFEASLNELRNVKRTLQLSLNDSRTNYSSTITSFLAKVETLLQNLQNTTDKRMETLFQNRVSELQTHLDICDGLVTEFQNLKTQLSDSNDDGKRFVTMKNAKRKLSEARNTLVTLSPKADYGFQFTLDDTILRTIEKADTLGTFDIKPTSSSKIKSLVNYKKIKIRASDDKKTCDIQGICILPDGTVILTDHKNKNIKRLDNDYNVVEICLMPGSPHGVCSVDTKTVAVSLGSKNKVQIVSVKDQMTKIKDLTFTHICNGIAYKDDTLYLTSGYTALYVYALDLNSDRKECTLIRTFDDNSPKSVALSPDGKFVYLVGVDDELIIQDTQGGHVSSTKHPSMKKNGQSPCVCVDMKGNVLVSQQFGGLLQFKDSGVESNGILIEETNEPEVVFVDYIRSKLILQRNGLFGGSDIVDVWDIVY